ncbi:MAG: FecR domain-containing protein, partial [Arenicellales bacterium]|nr:FecR domain-containing protein [Arenicellales bacterium]
MIMEKDSSLDLNNRILQQNSRGGLALLLLIVLLSSPLCYGDARKIGVTASVSGEVTVTDQGTSRVLEDGMPLFADGLVKASAGSSAELVFLDQSRIRLGSDSELVLDSFIYNPESQSGIVVTDYLKGVFRWVSGILPSTSYHMTTPVASISIRGTTLELLIADITGATLAKVEFGEVWFKNDTGFAKLDVDQSVGRALTEITSVDIQNQLPSIAAAALKEGLDKPASNEAAAARMAFLEMTVKETKSALDNYVAEMERKSKEKQKQMAIDLIVAKAKGEDVEKLEQEFVAESRSEKSALEAIKERIKEAREIELKANLYIKQKKARQPQAVREKTKELIEQQQRDEEKQKWKKSAEPEPSKVLSTAEPVKRKESDGGKLEKELAELTSAQLVRISTLPPDALQRVTSLDKEDLKKITERTTEEVDRLSILPVEALRGVARLSEEDIKKITELSRDEVDRLGILPANVLQGVARLSKEDIKKITELSREEVEQITNLPEKDVRKIVEELAAKKKTEVDENAAAVAESKAKEAADKKAKEAADKQAKEAADKQAKEAADKQAKEAAD